MYNILFMKILGRLRDPNRILPDITLREVFIFSFLGFDHFMEIATVCIFHNYIQPFFITERGVVLDYIRMTDFFENTDFFMGILFFSF